MRVCFSRRNSSIASFVPKPSCLDKFLAELVLQGLRGIVFLCTDAEKRSEQYVLRVTRCVAKHTARNFLAIWPTVLDWCLVVSFLLLLLGHYSVHIGYQREHNYTETILKHIFLNKTATFCAVGLLDKSCSKKLHAKKKNAILHKFCLLQKL